MNDAIGTLNVSLPWLLEERCHPEGSVRDPQLQTLLRIRHTAGVQPLAGGILASSSSSLCFKATSTATGPWLMEQFIAMETVISEHQKFLLVGSPELGPLQVRPVSSH